VKAFAKITKVKEKERGESVRVKKLVFVFLKYLFAHNHRTLNFQLGGSV
jgi:hypothetical protein